MGATSSRLDHRPTDKLVTLLAPSATESSEPKTAAVTPETPSPEPQPPGPMASQNKPLESFSSVIEPKTEDGKRMKGKSWWKGFERSELPNPGSYDELSQESQMVVHQNAIEGLSFTMTVPQTANFASGIGFDLGSKERPAQFGILNNYFTSRLVAITRFTPSDGHLNGRLFYKNTPSCSTKLTGDIAFNDLLDSRLSMEVDYRGSDFCGILKFASGGVCALNYLQSITPWLALGGEGFYQTKSSFSAITFAAKYAHDKDIATVSAATFGPLFFTFARKVSPKCTLAAELFVDARTRDSQLSAGYRFDFRQASVTGTVDSTGRVAAIVEEKINPGFALILSAELDHAREDYKFGIGANFGQ